MEYERFGALVAPHTDVMARVAAALVGMADAEDAAQEALMRAWRAWPALREEGHCARQVAAHHHQRLPQLANRALRLPTPRHAVAR